MLKPNPELIFWFAVVCSTLFLLSIALVAYFIFGINKKQLAYSQKLEEYKAEQKNILLQSQLEIQEQTFQNISREIHDNIGQKLTLAKLNLNMLGNSFQNDRIIQSIGIIGEVISDLRDLSRGLNSDLIKENGLSKAVETEIIQLEKLGMYKVDYLIKGDSYLLAADDELIIFRIIQEAINNILKHADANYIKITLGYDPTMLQIRISDNGKGFSDSLLKSSHGLGNMQKRASLINGKMHIKSLQGEGTTIDLQIPIKNNGD